MTGPAARSVQQKSAFLDSYSQTGNITRAAQLSGVSRRQHYHWLAEDAEYGAAFADAEVAAIDMLETEARRRAVEGTEKPVFQGGKQVGVVREYSDVLLIFLMKGARPQKYRDNVHVEVLTQDAVDAEIARLEAELGPPVPAAGAAKPGR